MMLYSPCSRDVRGREKSVLVYKLGAGVSMKETTDEEVWALCRGVYSLGAQHTVTRNFIHGRGGPSSVGRAGKNMEKKKCK